MSDARIHDLAVESRRVLDVARFIRRATDNDGAWSDVGAISDMLGEIIVRSADTPVPTPPDPPAPTPPPAPQFVAPLAPGAIYGKTKWLNGSLGADLFVLRGTAVVAPADCIVREVVGGSGLSGGAELILSLPDRSWAWRYRHIRSSCRVGQQVRQGELVATVNDDSLDLLGAVPAWFPAPDSYQHLDLSVDQGTDQFAPTGGGGGNMSAFQWLQQIGYQGTVVARTPGPPDAQTRARAAYLATVDDDALHAAVMREAAQR